MNKEKIIKTDEAIELFSRGKDRWNFYVEGCLRDNFIPSFVFSGIDFEEEGFEEADFKGFRFPASVEFRECTFKNADFSDCVFGYYESDANSGSPKIDFQKATFDGFCTKFDNANFHDSRVYFSECIFTSDDCSFNYSKFFNFVSFRGAAFGLNVRPLQTISFDSAYIEDFFAAPLKIEDDYKLRMFAEFVSFEAAQIRKRIDLSNARIECKTFSFRSTEFGKSDFETRIPIKFSGLEINAEEIRFIESSFVKTTVELNNAVFKGKTIVNGNSFDQCVVSFDEFACKRDFEFQKNILESTEISFRNFFCGGSRADIQINNQIGVVDFSGDSFPARLDIQGSDISGSISFDNRTFSYPPDLRRSNIEGYVSFQEVYVDPDFLKLDALDEDRFRRLKQIAHDNKDRENEINFLEAELTVKANRTNKFWEKSLIRSYKYYSDFGRSFFLPFAALLCFWIVYSAIYVWSSLFYKGMAEGVVSAALKLSFLSLLPTFIVERQLQSKLKAQLFSSDYSILLDFVFVSETALGLLFLFLIGLALRNRFRI